MFRKEASSHRQLEPGDFNMAEQSQLLSATFSTAVHTQERWHCKFSYSNLTIFTTLRQWLSDNRLRNPKDRFIFSVVVLLPTHVAEGRQNIRTESPFKMAQNVEVSLPKVKSEHCSLQLVKIQGSTNHSCPL